MIFQDGKQVQSKDNPCVDVLEVDVEVQKEISFACFAVFGKSEGLPVPSSCPPSCRVSLAGFGSRFRILGRNWTVRSSGVMSSVVIKGSLGI